MTQKIVFCFHTNDHEYNMGIGFLTASLKQHSTDVDLVIYREIKGKQVDTPEKVAAQILEKGPTIAAFSVMTFNWSRIKRVISILRQEYDGLVLVGGYHAILSPEEVLSCPGVDAVCVGEGEQPILELVRYYNSRNQKNFPVINGMVFKDENITEESFKRRWLIENLGDYPYMDYALFDSEGDTKLHQKHLGTLSPSGIFSLPLITGRGCPYRCTYCSNSALIECYGGLKNFLRRYSPGPAIANIKALVNKHNPQFLEFVDETFTLNKAWVKDFCLLYKREISIPFSVMSRIDTVDEQTISVLAESGLRLFFFGIECGDEKYRIHYLKRKMSNNAIREGAKLLKKYGIIIVTFNMFGMPFETKETVSKTFALNTEIEPDAAIPFIYQPFPGTELAKLAYENNMAPRPPEDRWDYCTPSLDTPDLPSSYVVEMVEKFWEKFGNQHTVQNLYSKLQSIVTAKKNC